MKKSACVASPDVTAIAAEAASSRRRTVRQSGQRVGIRGFAQFGFDGLTNVDLALETRLFLLELQTSFVRTPVSRQAETEQAGDQPDDRRLHDAAERDATIGGAQLRRIRKEVQRRLGKVQRQLHVDVR